MEALAAAPLDSLRSLDLSATGLDEVGLRVLASSPRLAGLRSLRLTGRQLGDDGARALAESPYLTNLTDLTLQGTDVGPEGAAALGRAYVVVGSADTGGRGASERAFPFPSLGNLRAYSPPSSARLVFLGPGIPLAHSPASPGPQETGDLRHALSPRSGAFARHR